MPRDYPVYQIWESVVQSSLTDHAESLYALYNKETVVYFVVDTASSTTVNETGLYFLKKISN